MPITVGPNIASLRAQRALADASTGLSKTFERLSSGQRITSAADDAAGLALATQLNSDGVALNQGRRNLSDGLSLLSVAESAAQELSSILSRQSELATQAGNGVYTDAQRSALDTEFQALANEYNRIIDTTTFNGHLLFADSNTFTLQAGRGANATIQFRIGQPPPSTIDENALLSTSTSGTLGNGNSSLVAVSGNGRYVAFTSVATNLVGGDSNGVADVFVRDTVTGVVERVSISSAGVQGGAMSTTPSISNDGRYIAFQSNATNLVAGDSNFNTDIFVYDRQTATTRRVSVDSLGGQSNGHSYDAAISADGNYVTYHSAATNLVAGDSNGVDDVFVYNMTTGATTRVSVATGGGQSNALSINATITGDGRYVFYQSNATNLVAGDTNGVNDIFRHDTLTGVTERVSLTSSNGQGNSHSYNVAISVDGRYITFEAFASNLVPGDVNSQSDIFVRDLTTGITRLISRTSSGTQGNGGSVNASISNDGRYVVYQSAASNLVTGDTNGVADVFLTDTTTGITTRVSVDNSGAQVAGASSVPVISADGSVIYYQSTATNLVSGDSNGVQDIFATPRQGDDATDAPVLSANSGLSVATQSNSLSAIDGVELLSRELLAVQGTIGATMSRLGSAIRNVESSALQYQTAAARILDVDVAAEVAELLRKTALQNAASAVLAQANMNARLVEKLLAF